MRCGGFRVDTDKTQIFVVFLQKLVNKRKNLIIFSKRLQNEKNAKKYGQFM